MNKARPHFIGSAFLLSVAVLSVTGASAPGKTSPERRVIHDDSSAVAGAVESFHKALEAGDSTAALALLASDAVILESGGVETVADYRSHHLPGDIEFSRAVKSVTSPVKVKVSDNTAWTVATSTTQGNFNGRAINSTGAESMVLTRFGSSWRIRSIHWSSRSRRSPAT